jgi:succinate dehydrogenase / fumarate reductase cytochrome b subunit
MDRYYETPPLPKAFIWRRLQSLMGLWLVLFLIEHLLTNSQAALPIGEDGNGFIRGVNFIKSLPYLSVIEISLLGIPFFIHMVWGIKYLMTSKSNAYVNTGKDPYLPDYPRNKAYTWQRITSWILLVLVIGHVVQMRFLHYPTSVKENGQTLYFSRIDEDQGVHTLAQRLNIQLYDEAALLAKIERQRLSNESQTAETSPHLPTQPLALPSTPSGPTTSTETQKLLLEQSILQKQNWIQASKRYPLSEGQLLAVSPDFGTASLLLVRETFKQPLMLFLYTVLVLAAVYHAFNGLWTFCITWGITLTARSQNNMRKFTVLLTILIGALGLAAIWGTYFINLKQ